MANILGVNVFLVEHYFCLWMCFSNRPRLHELHCSVSILPLQYKRSMSNAPHLKVNSHHAHHLLGILSGKLPDGIVYHSVSRGQPLRFFNLDLPIKYAPHPELHGLKWRHKLPTNHAHSGPSQGRGFNSVAHGQQVHHGLNPVSLKASSSNVQPSQKHRKFNGNHYVTISMFLFNTA